MHRINEKLAKVLGSVVSKNPLRSQSGQALVEFAFAVPILLLLTLGVIEIGRYAYIAILVGNAARAGAAYGAKGLAECVDTTNITGAAKRDFGGATSANGFNQSTLAVASTTTCGCDLNGTISSDTAGNCNPGAKPVCAGNWVITVHVTASGSFNALFNYPGIPSPLAVSSTSSMRVAKN